MLAHVSANYHCAKTTSGVFMFMIIVDIRINDYYVTLICDMAWNSVAFNKLRDFVQNSMLFKITDPKKQVLIKEIVVLPKEERHN